jgi:hypothetical protein
MNLNFWGGELKRFQAPTLAKIARVGHPFVVVVQAVKGWATRHPPLREPWWIFKSGPRGRFS